jgi:diguanylate cyclase (GGDEF)-like protein
MTSRLLDAVPIGVFAIDNNGFILHWNVWMSDNTGISSADAVNKRLHDLFPGFRNPRFDIAVQQVIGNGGPQILSQALHKYLIPIEQKHLNRHGLGLMRQHIHIEPADTNNGVIAVVSIIDVSGSVMRTEALTDVAQRLEFDVNRDPLTGLFNRRFMWEWLDHQFKQAERYEYIIAAIMLDIDMFKEINDKHGHHTGDLVLKELASLLHTCVRESDIVVRYGGEEFLLLLPRCSRDMAREVAERVRRIIAENGISGFKPGMVTCSLGVALYEPEVGLLPDDLLKEADRLLYIAKSSGRNQVTCIEG